MRPLRLCLLALLGLALLMPASGVGAASAGRDGTTATPAAAKKKKKKGKAKKRRACVRRVKKKMKHRSAKARRRAIARRCRKPRKKKRPPVARPAPAPAPPAAPPRTEGGIDDAVVVAVLDGGLNPYHWDFLASKMPQHQDADPGNDLPLDRPAAEWLPGVAQAGFAGFDRLDLTLDAADPDASSEQLHDDDDARWSAVKASSPDKPYGYWIPGTKVIGAVDFSDAGQLYQGVDAHGVGTTSSAVGNLHGTCPECLLVFVDTGDTPEEGEEAINWVMRQPWIDAISNSYGFSLVYRDRIWSGSHTELQRQASERGQSIFFSAGNGNDGAFVVPNTTEFSSQEGPDWIVTVGAVSPGDGNYYGADSGSGSYTGAGKPADIAGIGSDYPTAYTADSVGGTGSSGFGGTSNATPQVAGMYARALYRARTLLPGPSRVQDGGLVASGGGFACAAERPDCELGDARLTAGELRTRLFAGALHSESGFAVYSAGAGADQSLPAIGEEEFLNEGHGSYNGRESGDRDAWLGEFDRIVAPMEGRAKPLERPAGEREWMIVDSYCRQSNWGAWPGGYFVEGATELPGADPAWPVRSLREETCPGGPP